MTAGPQEPDRSIDPRALRLARRLGISRAVFYSILNRGWQVLAGPVTVLVIVRYYSTDEQGYYYAFLSILAMLNFFELGLSGVVVNVAAHEWASLQWTVSRTPVGDARALSRLRSLARFILRWYLVVASLFLIGVGIAGVVMFTRSPAARVDWFLPWVAVVTVSAAQLICLPFNSLLEGCNRAAEVNKFLFAQAAVAALALWIVIPTGGSLWAVVASAGVRLASNLVFLASYRGFLLDLLRADEDGEAMNWRTELWPLQWRIGVQGAASWFHFSLFVPVLFHYRGTTMAGQFGMTLQIVSVLQVAAYAWVQTRAAEMAIHTARRNYQELEALWRRGLVMSVAVMVAAAVGFELCLLALNRFAPSIAVRMLDGPTTAVLLAGRVVFVVILASTVYVRAHRIEPYAPMMVSVSLLQGGVAWFAGVRYGAMGQAVGALAVYLLVGLPWAMQILARTRRDERVATV